MKRHHQLIGHCLTLTLVYFLISCSTPKEKANLEKNNQSLQATPISQMRQLTFEGSRTGEGYFSPDGQLMIFQSEREAGNPFYQMYVKNFATNLTTRVSTGIGKTTCGWILPNKQSVVFSSTHKDAQAQQKQLAELDFRKSGKQRRYSWDYDENYDIFKASINGKNLVNLTKIKGYDAEGSASPDGRLIVFASNRRAYSDQLSETDQKKLELDPAYFMDIYVMNADGTNVRQITQTPGYDGGPFFSPDGQRIVWRRFSPDGHSAEIFTMKVDGSDQKQITNLKAMSWAPFYHPSGDYIVFTTNIHGYQNFELYIVDSEGQRPPQRVTELEGFDGLPVFTPDGQKLTWNRKLNASDSQIVIANWDDSTARKLLNLPPAPPNLKTLSSTISQNDLKQIVGYLASKELQGRGTGSAGEALATKMIGQYFSDLKLQPLSGNTYFQNFEFTKETLLGSQNNLTLMDKTQTVLSLGKEWLPLAASKTGEFAAAPVVFAGYGIRAPGDQKMAPYDSYAGIDVKDKWVLIFRYSPEDVKPDRRIFLQRYSKLEHKLILARDLGARGVLFVSGPNSKVKDQLIPLSKMSNGNLGIAAISISDTVAEKILFGSVKLGHIQEQLDKELTPSPLTNELPKISARIDLRSQKGVGQNVLGLLKVPGAKHTLVIGAHGDHLGMGHAEGSLRNKNDSDSIHYGADDNASGVSAVLELAHHFIQLKTQAPNMLKQNLLFAVWSGEELGNLGSSFFVQNLKKLKISPSAYVNMDMIGRWKDNTQGLEPLNVQGIGSSPNWRSMIEQAKFSFAINLQEDPYLPTDAMAFYLAKIPVVNFFTGVHQEYHTPRDTAEKINYPGLETITSAIGDLAQEIVKKDSPLEYKAVTYQPSGPRRGFRIYLGTIPDYTQEKISGVKLSGVVTGGPADKAGLKGGDIIVELSQRKIETIHDYVYSLETMRPNEPTQVVVLRNGRREEIAITPIAKE